MQHCVGDDLLATALPLTHAEHRLLAGRAHLGEHVVVAGIDALARHHFPQRRCIGGHPEDAWGGGGIDHPGLQSFFREQISRELGNLLGRARTLDRHRRTGEHCLTCPCLP